LSHLALDGVEDLSLAERVVRVQTGHLIANLAYLDHTKARRSVLSDQVLGDVTGHILLEHEEVLVLLEHRDWVLDKTFAQLSSAVRAD